MFCPVLSFSILIPSFFFFLVFSNVIKDERASYHPKNGHTRHGCLSLVRGTNVVWLRLYMDTEVSEWKAAAEQ